MTLHEFLFLTALIATDHREDFEKDERKNIPPTGSESKDEDPTE